MPGPVDPFPNDPIASTLAEAAKIDGKFDALFSYLTGNVDDSAIKVGAGLNLSTKARAVDLDKLGLSSSSTIRRGKSIIDTEEIRNSTSYGAMPTADRVSNLVMPTDGLIFVLFQALGKVGASEGFCGLFLNGTQVQAPGESGNRFCEGSVLGSTNYGWITTGYAPAVVSGSYITNPSSLYSEQGISWVSNVGADAPPGPSTGFVVGVPGANTGSGGGPAGAPLAIWAAAGTYTVEFRFKSTAAVNVTLKRRKLWAWTMGF
jgi:hypothetical protein